MLTPLGGEDGQVGDAVAIEVGHADDLGGARGLDRDGIGEAAAAQAREHVERVRAGVDRHEIGGTAGRERSGGDAHRRIQAGHLGRARAGIDRRQPGARAIRDEGCEGAVAQVVQDAHLAGQLVGDHEIEPAASRRIDRLRRRRRPGRRGESPAGERPGGRSGARWDQSNIGGEEDRERAVAGIADDQVIQAVAVQVGRDDLRRELAGRERPDPNECPVAPGVERDASSWASTLASTGVPRSGRQRAMSREG